MTARLAFEENYLEIANFRYYPEEAARGNPYNCTFDLAVRSCGFGGTAPCEYDIKDFRQFAADLRKLYDFEKNSVTLDDMCCGSRVEIAMDRAGHMKVSGKIFGWAMDHSLEFTFPADQTVLLRFYEELGEILLCGMGEEKR